MISLLLRGGEMVYRFWWCLNIRENSRVETVPSNSRVAMTTADVNETLRQSLVHNAILRAFARVVKILDV